MNQTTLRQIAIIYFFFSIFSKIYCIDNPHYYKAPYFNATKSWNSKNWISIFDVNYSHGSSHSARNAKSDKKRNLAGYWCGMKDNWGASGIEKPGWASRGEETYDYLIERGLF